MFHFFKTKLKRELGLFHTTMIGVGIIIGAGIYVLLGEAAGYAGNSVWLSFAISAVVALFTGFSYAELSSMFPKDSAEYLYTKNAFGERLAFFIGYFVLFAAIIAAAAVSTGFAGYFTTLFGFGNTIAIAIIVIFIFSTINFFSIKGASWTNVIFTILSILGLLLIIVLGFTKLGSVSYLEMPNGITGVFKGAALVFFAFLGFESIAKLSEECENPRKNIPLALLLSIFIATGFYILVAIATVSILDWQTLAVSKAPLAEVAAAILGGNAFIALSIIALFSTANTVLISLIAGSRTLYGIGENYKLLKPFTVVHKKHGTPHVAIFAVMCAAILFTFLQDIGTIAELTNFTLFITFAVINAAVIYLRFKMPKEKREFKMPLNIGRIPVIAIIGILTCIFLLFQLELFVILGGTALALTGLVIYAIVNFFERKDPSRR